MQHEIKHTRSSGNVFADMGLPDADVLLEEADRKIEQRLRCEQGEARSIIARLRGVLLIDKRIHRRRRPCQ